MAAINKKTGKRIVKEGFFYCMDASVIFVNDASVNKAET